MGRLQDRLAIVTGAANGLGAAIARRLGGEGVLAVVGDSTNAVRDGRSPSEADVARTLAELIAASPARIAITTFASNVARIRAVADGAKAAGREVIVVGRAMERVVQVARETGLAPKKFAPGAIDALRHHPFPGNIRELRNLVDRLVIMSPGATVSAYSRRPCDAARTRMPSRSMTDSLTPSPSSAASLSRKGCPIAPRSKSLTRAATWEASARSRRPK